MSEKIAEKGVDLDLEQEVRWMMGVLPEEGVVGMCVQGSSYGDTLVELPEIGFCCMGKRCVKKMMHYQVD